MGDPHNPARIGEMWNPHRWAVLASEIEAVREYGALSGGWAWHYMSPPHQEEKHLHDHRDIDMHVFPDRYAELVVALQKRGYHRQTTRFDDPSGEFIRFEKHVQDACMKCYGQVMLEGTREGTDEPWWICLACKHDQAKPPPPVKVIFDLFVHEVPTIEVNGYTVVEPNLMLTFYGVKHSSEQCVAVQSARRIQAAGGEIVNNPLLVGDWGLPWERLAQLGKGRWVIRIEGVEIEVEAEEKSDWGGTPFWAATRTDNGQPVKVTGLTEARKLE